MKRVMSITIVLGALVASGTAFAQTPDESTERALMAAPRNMKADATVIKFKADGSYDTVKKGTNRLVCYDRSGDPGQQPFAVQCTSIANIPRVVQNRKFEAMSDKAAPHTQQTTSSIRPAFDAESQTGAAPSATNGRLGLRCRGPYDQPPSQ